MTRINASDIMTTQVVTAVPNMGLVAAGKLMNKYRIGGLPVLNGKGRIVGILTERDIMREVIAANKKPSSLKVRDIMKTQLITGEPSENMTSLAKKMHKFDLTRIPIVNGEKLVGIVTNKDIIEHAPSLIELIIEQARVKGPALQYNKSQPVAFGKCEKCGIHDHLTFKENQFLCEFCL